MFKMKTKKALQKRVKITAKFRVKRSRAGRSHLMRKKSSPRRLKLKRPAIIRGVEAKKIKRMLSYK